MSHSSVKSIGVRATTATWWVGSILALGLLTSGDRSVLSASTGNAGIDPLEILNLAVRANAILVMDSSGSMADTASGVSGLADDDPDSKIGAAKIVLKNVISANQTKVSFQFGIYDQQPTSIPINTQTSQSASATRFQYTAKNAAFTTEPAVQLRLFEVPTATNWVVDFANGATAYTTAAIPARVYTGTELAQQIATLMTAKDSTGYTGSFNDPAIPGAPVFTFTRTGGTLPFVMKFSLMNATLRGLLRAVSTDSNDVTSPFVVVPNLGSFTTFTLSSAPPNSFIISGAPTIRIGRGGTNFSGNLTNATYTGAALATHIASVMATIDTGDTASAPPNSFVITGGPSIRIARGGTSYTGNLSNGTYTGAQLATHISDVMDSIDTGSTAQADYSGTYNTATGIFTFTRAGSDVTNAFTIRWASWSASLKGTTASTGGMGAPGADVSDTTSAPYSLGTLGGLVPVVSTLDTYSGAYNTTTGVFTFTRAGSTGASFDILWTNWTASLVALIGAPGSNASDTATPFTLATLGLPPVTSVSIGSTTTSSGPANSTAPLVLYRRSDSGTYEVTDGANRYLSIFANKYFNGQTLSVLTDGTPCFLTAGTPVVTPAVPPITVQVVPSCGGAATTTVVFLLRGASAITGPANEADCGGFKTLVGLADCLDNDQFTKIATPYLDNELGMSGSSIIGYTETDGVGGGGTQPTQGSRNPTTGALIPGGGIRASQSTPIAESLIDIKTIFQSGLGAQPATPFVLPLPQVRAIWPIIAGQTKKQRTFVIFVTDGDDTCTTTTSAGSGTDNDALRAAHKAQLLYQRVVATEPESSVTTYFIAFGTGAAADRSNWIAWGGSGMKFGSGSTGGPYVDVTTGSGTATRWSRKPTAAERLACTTCKDAILATDSDKLADALQAAIDQGQTSGEFSDQQSITETVYEYAHLAPPPSSPTPLPTPVAVPYYNSLSPDRRYGTSIPVLLQSTFELPDFNGHLKAFVRGDNGTPANLNDDVSLNVWDAGAKLMKRVVTDSGAMGTTTTYTFAQLYGNATPTTVRTSSARIKRRIFTSSGQGVLAAYNSANLLADDAAALQGTTTAPDLARVDLWPPSSTVAPTANAPAPAGILDAAMGLSAPTTVAQVQAIFPMACVASSDATPRNHADCTSATTSVQVARAKREAREAILAYLAGARVSNVSGAPDRTTTGDMLFVSRPWIMSESTLAAPAVVTPPLQAPFLAYRDKEYTLYRDGVHDGNGTPKNAIRNGLGLRNPDVDEFPATKNISRDDMELKPQMSVVYHATNQGLHAFRAGPCPVTPLAGGFTALGTLGCAGETGGEELWAFVPYDQLGKLASLLKIQSRSNKTYILAAPVRISDVFVPGSTTRSIGGVSVTVGGVWRTLAIFGRGIAGKSLTALDVTIPGPYTWNALDSRPPLIVWSRGNYDTKDGLIQSGSSVLNHNQADYDAYLGMGETWSVPAVSRVDPTQHRTGRRPSGVEFAMYMGSGYTNNTTTEGKTFYVLDTLSGDVIQSFALPNGTVVQSGLSLPNALPASPAIYTVEPTTGLSPSGVFYRTNGTEAQAKQVYFGDLHSRVWRYSPDNPTAPPTVLADLSSDGDQPFANGLALLEHDKVPQVFLSGGRDSRVNLRVNSPRFRMYGYKDGPSAATPEALAQLFARDFPVNYRGNSAPAAGFTGGDVDGNPATPDVGIAPIVFFTGLSFAAGTDATQPCVSRFDSVLFALQGLTGLAALNLNSTSSAESDDAFATIQGQVLQNPHITTEGTLVVDRGLGAQAAPPPPAPPDEQPAPPKVVSTTIVNAGLAPGSAAYRILKSTTTPWRTGTAVCNVNPNP